MGNILLAADRDLPSEKISDVIYLEPWRYLLNTDQPVLHWLALCQLIFDRSHKHPPIDHSFILVNHCVVFTGLDEKQNVWDKKTVVSLLPFLTNGRFSLKSLQVDSQPFIGSLFSLLRDHPFSCACMMAEGYQKKFQCY